VKSQIKHAREKHAVKCEIKLARKDTCCEHQQDIQSVAA